MFAPIAPPDEAVAQDARKRQAVLTKPPGSLGRVEEIGVWIAACQGQCPPAPLVSPTVVVFAGDHGVARGGVSAFPPEVTAQMVANIAAGGAAVNVMAGRVGAAVKVVDMSVDADTPPELSRYKVRRSSEDLRTTDTISLAEAREALAAGRAIADDLVDRQVGPHRMSRHPDLVGFVGLQPVHRVAILVREDRDRARAQFVGGAECADGDLAAVGDQNLVEHRGVLSLSRLRRSGACSATRTIAVEIARTNSRRARIDANVPTTPTRFHGQFTS